MAVTKSGTGTSGEEHKDACLGCGMYVWGQGTRGQGSGDVRSGIWRHDKQTEPFCELNEYKIQLLEAGFSVKFSVAIAELFSPETFATKVILSYLYLVNKPIMKHFYSRYTY